MGVPTFTLNFPAGMSEFRDRDGAVYHPDANGQATVPVTSILPLLGGGGMTSEPLDALSLGGTALTVVAAEVNQLASAGAVQADFIKLHALTATAAELNYLHAQGCIAADFAKLHALTATAAEINVLHSVTAGTVAASSAVVVDANKNVDNLFFGSVASLALLTGGGSAASPLSTAVAGVSFIQFYTKTTDTGDNNRCAYFKHTTAGAGSTIDAVRPYALVNGVAAANARAVFATVELDATGSVTGSAYALSGGLMIDAASRTVGGALACIDLTSYVGTGNTLSNAAFIHVSDAGAVAVINLFNLDSVSTASKSDTVMVATGCTDHASEVRIKCRVNGAALWLMATATVAST